VILWPFLHFQKVTKAHFFWPFCTFSSCENFEMCILVKKSGQLAIFILKVSTEKPRKYVLFEHFGQKPTFFLIKDIFLKIENI